MNDMRKCVVCGCTDTAMILFCPKCGGRMEVYSGPEEKTESPASCANIEPESTAPSVKKEPEPPAPEEPIMSEEPEALSLFGILPSTTADDKKSAIGTEEKERRNINLKPVIMILTAVVLIAAVTIGIFAVIRGFGGRKTAPNDSYVEDTAADIPKPTPEPTAISEPEPALADEIEIDTDTILFNEEVGIGCNDTYTMENTIASFRYNIRSGETIFTEPFYPSQASIFIATMSALHDGISELTDDREEFRVQLYDYSDGIPSPIDGYTGKCDLVEGGVEFNVDPYVPYVLSIGADVYKKGEILKGHGHIYGVEYVGEDAGYIGDSAVAGSRVTAAYEPKSMHYYEEIYYGEQTTYVLDYNLKFEHDSQGRITTVSCYDPYNNLEDQVMQQYDTKGRCTREYYLLDSPEGLELLTYDIFYDGNIETRSNEYGTFVYTNDASGNHLYGEYSDNQSDFYAYEEYYYDNQNRVSAITRTNMYTDWSWSMNSTYYYDGDDSRPYYVEWDIVQDSSHSLNEDYYTYEYDAMGRLIREEKETYSDGMKYSYMISEYEY